MSETEDIKRELTQQKGRTKRLAELCSHLTLVISGITGEDLTVTKKKMREVVKINANKGIPMKDRTKIIKCILTAAKPRN